jgi:hypothetical protein
LIGYALGGRPGERLAQRIGLSVSNDTLLRWVKRCAQPTAAARVIGIDEWAKRKGRTYGTIVVDLERHTVIDVLEQGSAETFREYLRQRWDAGYRNGRVLLDELRALGYQGTYKAVGKIVSPWRQGNVDYERTTTDVSIPAPPPPVLTDLTQRQISPHIAATLLTIPRPDLTGRQRADR